MQEQVSLLIHRDKAVVVSEMCDEDQDKQQGLMKELIKLMEIQLIKADGPSSSPVSSKISATEGKCFPAQARNASKITSWMALWHYLRDRGEDMRKCTLMPSSHEGTESIHICGVSGGSQELTALEAKIRLTGTDWQKHPIVTGPGAPCMLDIDCLRRGISRILRGIDGPLE